MEGLIAYEESQIVTMAFVNKGENFRSCDIQNTSGPRNDLHIRQDAVLTILKQKWDFIGLHCECRYVANSGNRWYYNSPQRERAVKYIIEVFEMACIQAKHVYLENPIGVLSKWRKPSQIIQPWQFGHKETKATCLWLHNLPLLRETSNVKKWLDLEPDKIKHRIHRLPPSEERSKIRSKTYLGIAYAMAEQWTPFINA